MIKNVKVRQWWMAFGLLAMLCAWQVTSHAQPKDDSAASTAKPGTRFEFEIVESFDAKYPGDTPGHIGQAGGLGSTRPRVALGDTVYRGQEKIGTISTVNWSHARGSLTVEFDPAPELRIAVGDIVWVDLNPEEKEETKK